MKLYLYNLLIGIDQFANVLLGGAPDITISSRVWYHIRLLVAEQVQLGTILVGLARFIPIGRKLPLVKLVTTGASLINGVVH